MFCYGISISHAILGMCVSDHPTFSAPRAAEHQLTAVVRKDHSVVMPCYAEGNPPPSFWWVASIFERLILFFSKNHYSSYWREDKMLCPAIGVMLRTVPWRTSQSGRLLTNKLKYMFVFKRWATEEKSISSTVKLGINVCSTLRRYLLGVEMWRPHSQPLLTAINLPRDSHFVSKRVATVGNGCTCSGLEGRLSSTVSLPICRRRVTLVACSQFLQSDELSLFSQGFAHFIFSVPGRVWPTTAFLTPIGAFFPFFLSEATRVKVVASWQANVCSLLANWLKLLRLSSSASSEPTSKSIDRMGGIQKI